MADPSASRILEFFRIAAKPDGKVLPANQASVVEVLLSKDLVRLRACMGAVFGINQPEGGFAREMAGGGGGMRFEHPGRVASLLAACVEGQNMQTATLLQQAKLTIDAALDLLCRRMDVLASRAAARALTG